jgi:hypothetical protein
MIKVNLISKKRRAYSGRNWTKIISYSLFGLLSVYFLSVTLYIVISTIVLNNKVANIDKESASISSSMLSNNEKLSRFVLTKLILSEYESINKNKFRYKDYLDQVSLLLPPTASLVGIDFKKQGWISLTISTNDVFGMQSLEDVLLDTKTWKDNKYFSGAYIEGVTKDKSGLYSTRLQIELKGNG